MKQENINPEKPVNQNALLEEIDKTLDKLISNALAIKAINPSLLFLEEVLMLQRTQEFLLAHLMQTQSLLHSQDHMKSTPSYRHKFILFETLSSELVSKVHEAWAGRRKESKIRKVSESPAQDLKAVEEQRPLTAYSKEQDNP